MGVCESVQLPVEPREGVLSSYELPDRDARNWTQIYCKAETTSLAPNKTLVVRGAMAFILVLPSLMLDKDCEFDARLYKLKKQSKPCPPA